MKTTTSKTVAAKFPALLGVEAKNVQRVLYALGIRKVCTRCAGSGHYSRNSLGDTRCYDCKGRKFVAANLDKATLAAAQAKVEAGELATLRAKWAAAAAARRQVQPIVDATLAAYDTIGNAYTVASKYGTAAETVRSPIFRAQTMNNEIVYGEFGIHRTVDALERGKIGAHVALARVTELCELAVALRATWLAFEAVDVAA